MKYAILETNQEVNTIFGASLIKGITAKDKAIYINEAHRSEYPTVLTNLPPTPSRPISSQTLTSWSCTSYTMTP